MARSSTYFAPVPARAISDARLRGLHWKILAAVAPHDRMSAARDKGGQGCWAGNKRLTRMIGCHYTNLSTALSELEMWGYIERKPNPANKRRRVLYVIYDERDAALVGTSSED